MHTAPWPALTTLPRLQRLPAAPGSDFALCDAVKGEPVTVLGISAPPGCDSWVQQLQDLGFTPGERVTLMTRGLPGGDPLVVRVGLSTYALRRAEAACVRVSLGATSAA